MKKRSFLVYIFVLLLSFSCARKTYQPPVSVMRFVMDTIVRVSVYEADADEKKVLSVIEDAFEMMADIEASASVYVQDSDICQASMKAGMESHQIASDHALAVISAAIKTAEETDGVFDPTIGLVKNMWNFSSSPVIPDQDELSEALKRVNYKHLLLDGRSLKLLYPQMRLDAGGIAKGYAVDKAVEMLIQGGITAGIVDAGGDLRIFGKHPFKPLWGIGVQHPRSGRNKLAFEMHTGAVSIATSGDYERFFIKEGIRYHHILDPSTGMPAQGCVSVTIVTEKAMDADAWATAVFIMGYEKGKEFITGRNNIEGIIVYETEGRLRSWVSAGLTDKVKNLLEEEY